MVLRHWSEEEDKDYYWFTAHEVYVDDTWIEYSGWWAAKDAVVVTSRQEAAPNGAASGSV